MSHVSMYFCHVQSKPRLENFVTFTWVICGPHQPDQTIAPICGIANIELKDTACNPTTQSETEEEKRKEKKRKKTNKNKRQGSSGCHSHQRNSKNASQQPGANTLVLLLLP